MGQKVFEGGVLNGAVDVSGLQGGMYIVEVVSKEWRIRRKLVVE